MEALLKKGLAELRLDEGATPSLLRFGELLLEKNKVMNLTAITEPADVAALHFLDSAALLTLTDFKGKSVVDVGTGAGFPGMPLKILEPSIRMTLLDSLGKRITFLQEVCNELGLQNVQCVHARAEEFAAEHRGQFDFATSRAVANLSVLCELCLPLPRHEVCGFRRGAEGRREGYPDTMRPGRAVGGLSDSGNRGDPSGHFHQKRGGNTEKIPKSLCKNQKKSTIR